MVKHALITIITLSLTISAYSQTNNSGTSTSFVALSENSVSLGTLGRAGAITSAWNPLSSMLTLTYQGRDFAIGGWGKTTNNWMGASLFINSDNGNVGIGTTTPGSRLHIDGATTTNLVSFTEGSTNMGSLGRGATTSGAWNQNPDIFALTYQRRDFAIGGWGKSTNAWMGASLFINSDNGNVGIGTTIPRSRLHIDGATTTNLVSLAEGSTNLGSLGRGATTSGAWNQNPDIFALTYEGRDFAIGGWGKTANTWMGASLFINSDNGNVGIGTTTPNSKLTIAGNVHAREVNVSIDAGADFVFQEGYKLRPLEDVAEFIRVKSHLPEIASADEMKKDGMAIGEMNIMLLQKIEELTLYMINMKKQLESIEKENECMKREVVKLKIGQ